MSKIINAVNIKVGDHQVAVQCFLISDTPDRTVPGIAAMTEPVPVDQWPISVEKFEELAAKKLTDSGARASEIEDAVWVAENTYDEGDWYFRRARSEAERERLQHQGRRAYLRGDLT